MGICDGVPSIAALVLSIFEWPFYTAPRCPHVIEWPLNQALVLSIFEWPFVWLSPRGAMDLSAVCDCGIT